jgi:hypothetical protein
VVRPVRRGVRMHHGWWGVRGIRGWVGVGSVAQAKTESATRELVSHAHFLAPPWPLCLPPPLSCCWLRPLRTPRTEKKKPATKWRLVGCHADALNQSRHADRMLSLSLLCPPRSCCCCCLCLCARSPARETAAAPVFDLTCGRRADGGAERGRERGRGRYRACVIDVRGGDAQSDGAPGFIDPAQWPSQPRTSKARSSLRQTHKHAATKAAVEGQQSWSPLRMHAPVPPFIPLPLHLSFSSSSARGSGGEVRQQCGRGREEKGMEQVGGMELGASVAFVMFDACGGAAGLARWGCSRVLLVLF